MSFKIGIVGLPNVGKSTFFNAITKSQALAANYPFATIDPNVGVVSVPDERLAQLAAQEKSEKIIPTSIEFVDIAGLVSGAHQGEGLGNQFLSHIREVDAILEMVRFFEAKEITHVEGSVNPKRDMETISTELQLADLATVEKRLHSLAKQFKAGDKEAVLLSGVLDKYHAALSSGAMAHTVELTEVEMIAAKQLSLLTTKPFLYAANTTYNLDTQTYEKAQEIRAADMIPIDAQIEYELAQLNDTEREEYMHELHLQTSGLDEIVQTAYKTLHLITFITAGPKESKAWTITAGSTAPQAAGKIHTDFEKGFIRAEVISTEKLLEAGGYVQAKEKGWLRVEGKEYIVQDGDVVHFRFNV